MPSPSINSATPGKKSTRRPRAIQACNLCRSKKYKCDGNLPCLHCRRQCIKCVYQGSPKQDFTGHYSVAYAKKLERRLEAAEAALLSHGVILNDDLEACLVDGFGQNSNEGSFPSYPTPRIGQLPTPETFVTGPMNTGEHPGADSVVHSSEEAEENGDNEVMDVNTTTRGYEYHGQTSSIAFLERLRKFTESNSEPDHTPPVKIPGLPEIRGRSLVTDFHNNTFIDQHEQPAWNLEPETDEYYPLEAYTFSEAFFIHQHYMHPIVDKQAFLSKCRQLWDGQGDTVNRSWKAMYFALLALGALTRTWNEETINGMGRYEWTRILFRKAEHALGRPGSHLNLFSIQALFLMAKVCQYQLDLNLAYTYLGMAIRIALSCGINRLTVFRVKTFPQDSPTLMVARTWWCLYALEIELSFALGRPDTLGSDFHHNRPIPRVDNSEHTIVRATMDLSMIIRDVSTSSSYISKFKVPDRLIQAQRLERRLNDWIAQLPVHIRPTSGTDVLNSGSIRDPQWSKLQKLVLNIRYLHVMTVLFHPFFQYTSKTFDKQKLSPEIIEAAEKCVDSAVTMIRTIHDTYRMHHFMRTWWYNTVYISFGMSVLLFYEARRPFPSRWNYDILVYVEQALDALEAMEECTVASKIGNFARDLVVSLRKQREEGILNSISPNSDSDSKQLDSMEIGGKALGVEMEEGVDGFPQIPMFNDIFPDYIGEFHDFAEFGMFDGGFPALDPAMENSIGSSDSGIYPSPAML